MATREANRDLGVQIEKHRADERGRSAEHVGTDGWFDVDDGGTPVEVKSTDVEVAVTYGENDRTRPGRYQLVEDNHRNLLDHGGEYDFVLRDGETTAAERTMAADEVEDLLDGRTWPDGSKLKLLWTEIHPDEADRRGM